MSTSVKSVYYSEKYYDDTFEYRWASVYCSNVDECKFIYFRVVWKTSVKAMPSVFMFFERARQFIAVWSISKIEGVWCWLYLYLIQHRHVILPRDISKQVPNRLMTEDEWRALGVQQSQGWIHYMLHTPEPHILLFRRPITDMEAARKAQKQYCWMWSCVNLPFVFLLISNPVH